MDDEPGTIVIGQRHFQFDTAGEAPHGHTRSTGEPDLAHGPAHVEGELVKLLAQDADPIDQSVHSGGELLALIFGRRIGSLRPGYQ